MGDVNVYLFDPGEAGAPLTLLDTGPCWDPARQALNTQLKALGYRTSDLRQIIISHPHPDHYGLAGRLVEESGAVVLAHPHSRHILGQGTGNTKHEERFYHSWFTSNGVPVETQRAIAEARAQTSRFALPVRVDRFLRDGDNISLAARPWRVLATPGHSGGLICFFDPQSRTLLSSDHLIKGISSNPVIEPHPDSAELDQRPTRLLQYIAQLKRVAALQPVVAFPGHGPPIEQVGELVKERLAFHRERAEQLWQQLGRQPMTVHELSQVLFPVELPPVHRFLALSEVQGHLDLLEAAGRAEQLQGAAPIKWTATHGVAG